jgi:hypothetical protein
LSTSRSPRSFISPLLRPAGAFIPVQKKNSGIQPPLFRRCLGHQVAYLANPLGFNKIEIVLVKPGMPAPRGKNDSGI